MRLSRLWGSTGVRMALVQAALLVTVFAVAGELTKVSIKFVYRRELHSRIEGEVAALSAIAADRSKGRPALIKAIELAERHAGGLDYRLTDEAGRFLAGDLPATGAGPGWSYLDWDDEAVPGRPFEDIVVYTAPLADHAVLTIGKDLSEESKLRRALKTTLFWCGAVGAGLGLILSYIFTHGAFRRVAGVVSAARAVSAGRLQVRAPTRRPVLADDIDDLGGAFNSMLDEIATLMDRVRWVSTDIAHDLRTPLTHVRQKLELLKASPDDRVQAAALEIEADVDDLLRQFDAMLRLAEIENEDGGPAAAPVDLAELVLRIADAYRFDIEASGRRLEVACEPAVVRGEADLIALALTNLVENALRHTPSDAHIRITTGLVGDSPALGVSDDGPGIDEAQREAVLQRFYRLDVSRNTPGFGLGLAIVAAVTKRHRAVLDLSDAGPGLRAVLRFPAELGLQSSR